MRILIIDDSQADSETLKKLLKRRFNAEIFCASTMREAHSMVAVNNLDCVVLDLQLADSSIEQTLNEHLPKFPYPVFVYSGFDDPTYRKRAIDSGAEDYIVKGTGNASIIERIATLEYKRGHGGKELLQAAFDARRDEPKEKLRTEWKGTIPRLAASVISVLMFAAGIVAGIWGAGSVFGRTTEQSRQHFEKLDNAIIRLEEAGHKRDILIDDLKDKAIRSIDDRQSIRESAKAQSDLMIDWLKRIEAKVGSR